MRILVVEDNVDLNNAIVKLLKENYLSVDTVFDGEEALYYLESASYDVVILDVMLPKLDGIRKNAWHGQYNPCSVFNCTHFYTRPR